MRLDRLTNKFQLALADAQSLALGQRQPIHRTSSFNERLAESGRGSVRPLLTSAGVNAGKLRTDIEQALSRLPQVEGTGGDVQPSPGFSADPQPFATSWRKRKRTTLFRRNCSFWRRLNHAVR